MSGGLIQCTGCDLRTACIFEEYHFVQGERLLYCMQVKIYHGPLDVVNHVVMHEGGISGLFRGTAPTLLREVPGNVIMFGTYEGLKRLLAQQQV